MQVSKKRIWAYVIIAATAALTILVWHSVLFGTPATLRVSFLNVGEGNATLVQSPTGATILIDGGPDHSVLRALSGALGPINRTIDMVIETNTSASSALGLTSVFDRYRVRSFVTSGVPNKTTAARMVAGAAAHEPNLVHIEAHRGMRILFGGGAYADILFPDHAISNMHAPTTALVLRIVYGNTSFMLPSNVLPRAQNWLATLYASTTLASDVLSVGHYGAPNSVDSKWLTAVHPHFAVISVGKNRYGYPSHATRAQLTAAHAQVLTTQGAAITFTSDGHILRKAN